MLYQEDLAEAFYRKDIRAIEEAFRALVGYPKGQNIETPDTALLIECCRGLAADDSIMPSGTIDAINDVLRADAGEGLLYGCTYATGAGRVWKEIERFSPMFGEATNG